MNHPERPLLLPPPRNLSLTGGWAELRRTTINIAGMGPLSTDYIPGLGGRCRVVSSAASPDVLCKFLATAGAVSPTAQEHYRLRINPDPPITIESTSQAGMLNGLRTFGQLIKQYRKRLPGLVIEDSPSFPIRGVMLDISRDRVPTMDELLKFAETLASWKINHLQLYTEHTFAYIGHEQVWKNASPMTPEEIQTLDRRCRQLGIALAANQNCFGHLRRWLEHERYAHLAELHDDWDFNGHHRSGPFSLCPIDPGSIEFIEDLVGQLLPNFTSGLFNIGCDETFDVGQGRSKEAVRLLGKEAVYYKFVSQIVEIVRRHGFKPMFWADMALRSPTALRLVPEGMIALAWGYEPDAQFAGSVSLLRAAGIKTWVCPGTSSWQSIVGRTTERRANIAAAAVQGVSTGADGFLVTDWGDMGHRQQFPVSLNALAHAASAAWNADKAAVLDPAGISFQAFGDASGSASAWLSELGDVDVELRRKAGDLDDSGNPQPLRNRSCLFADLHSPFTGGFSAGSANEWRLISGRLNELAMRFPTSIDERISAEMKHTLQVAEFAAKRAVARRSGGKSSLEFLQQRRKMLATIIEEHRQLWSMRSRPGGLDDSCRYYEQVDHEF